jgi:hypothetical protein
VPEGLHENLLCQVFRIVFGPVSAEVPVSALTKEPGHLPFTALDTTWNEGYTEKSDFPKKGQRENRATQMVPF